MRSLNSKYYREKCLSVYIFIIENHYTKYFLSSSWPTRRRIRLQVNPFQVTLMKRNLQCARFFRTSVEARSRMEWRPFLRVTKRWNICHAVFVWFAEENWKHFPYVYLRMAQSVMQHFRRCVLQRSFCGEAAGKITCVAIHNLCVFSQSHCSMRRARFIIGAAKEIYVYWFN